MPLCDPAKHPPATSSRPSGPTQAVTERIATSTSTTCRVRRTSPYIFDGVAATPVTAAFRRARLASMGGWPIVLEQPAAGCDKSNTAGAPPPQPAPIRCIGAYTVIVSDSHPSAHSSPAAHLRGARRCVHHRPLAMRRAAPAGVLAALLAASALAAGAAAARPTRLGKFAKQVVRPAFINGGGIMAASVNVGETQDVFHYCDL